MTHSLIKERLEQHKEFPDTKLDYYFFDNEDRAYYSFLTYCMEKNYQDLFLDLINAGANPNFKTEDVRPPLSFISSNEFFIKHLLNHPDIDLAIDIKKKSLLTHFIHISERNHFNKFEIKNISMIVNKSRKKDSLDKQWFFNYTIESNLKFNDPLLRLLLKKTPSSILKDKLHDDMNTCVEFLFYYRKDEKIIDLILGVLDKSKVDKNKNNILHTAIIRDRFGISDNADIIVKILKHGFDQNIANQEGLVPSEYFKDSLKGDELIKYKKFMIEEHLDKLMNKIKDFTETSQGPRLKI